MPGFRYCQWCDGRGCVACPGEEKKFTERALASAPSWRDGDIRDIRDATIRAERQRAFLGLDALTEEEIEAAFKPALDAEYDRQFPNGPQPIFTARTGNAMDMELLKHVAHADVLTSAFGDSGGGLEEIEDRAAEARSLQRLHDAAEQHSKPPAE